MTQGVKLGNGKGRQFFFHPDFTVGIGISPNQRTALAGCTAGGESHPALKNPYELIYKIPDGAGVVKALFLW